MFDLPSLSDPPQGEQGRQATAPSPSLRLGSSVPTGDRTRPDASLPPCPLCGAVALQSAYRSAWDIVHDCDCLVEQEAAYYRALARLWQRRQHLERFLASLPDGYRGLSFDTFVRETGNAEALAAAQRLQKGEFLYLHGEPGRGKTHLAVAAARRLVEGGLAGLFLGEAAYFEALYQAFRGEGKAPEYSQAEVVVLDDLAKIRPSDFAYQTLYALIEHCSSNGKSLIVTSNYTPARAARRLAGGDREAALALTSRLAKGYTLEVTGQDRRINPIARPRGFYENQGIGGISPSQTPLQRTAGPARAGE